VATRVGYSGGDVPNATYRNHGTHAEDIKTTFDPSRTSFQKMLEFFFQLHDPTPPNRQGNDRRLGNRSAILHVDHDQRRIAGDTIADIDASGLLPGKVVTEVAPVGRSGRPSRSTRTIWSAGPAVTPAISSGRTGRCRSGSRFKVA